MSKIAVLGEGAWGTAIALLLADNGHEVFLWCYHKEVAEGIAQTRCNDRYMPGVTLPKNIIPTNDLSVVFKDSDYIFEVIPVKYLRTVLEQAKQYYRDDQTWVVLSKGIEQETLLFPTQIINDVFQADVHASVLAGPSFAKDIVEKKITAVTIAADTCKQGEALQQLVATPYFRPYITTDVMGVQAGAAFKNVLTLAIGILDGARYTDNSKAFIFTRGLHEMAHLAVTLGGLKETIYGLSGVGDLMLSATGSLSRNLEVGKKLGYGQDLETILKETGYIPEGINTVQSMHELICKKDLQLPICNGVYAVIFQKKSVHNFLDSIMSLPLTQECEQ